ncbi:MAG: energy transducer TonB [Gammaproteobacteria bacterium]
MHSAFQDVRFLLALVGGAIIALALFLFLHWLIAGTGNASNTAQEINLVNFVHVQRQPKIQTKQRVAPPPPKPPKHPPPPRQVETQTKSNVQTQHLPMNINFNANSLGNGAGVYINPSAGPATNAGGYAPLTPEVRFRPTYPPQAAIQNVTGTVTTCFTVEPSGAVSNPSVKHASSPQARHLLSQAALNAIRQWKFFPQKENGKPVATKGVCQLIKFKFGNS